MKKIRRYTLKCYNCGCGFQRPTIMVPCPFCGYTGLHRMVHCEVVK